MKMVNLSARLSNAVSTMTRILNVAEKNDAAKSLAEVLSRGNFRRVSETVQFHPRSAGDAGLHSGSLFFMSVWGKSTVHVLFVIDQP